VLRIVTLGSNNTRGGWFPEVTGFGSAGATQGLLLGPQSALFSPTHHPRPSPQGVNGRLNSSAGYLDAADGFAGFPGNRVRLGRGLAARATLVRHGLLRAEGEGFGR
jgi:hypothetical protein